MIYRSQIRAGRRRALRIDNILMHSFALLAALVLVVASDACAAPAAQSAWPPISSQTKPWTWWWWHGSAVDETNLARELREFHDAGLGGVQITSIYGVKGADARDIPYLTPHWLHMLDFSVEEARRLGMDVDMTLGSGWCFGGPTVSDRDANADVVVRTFKLGSGERLKEKVNRQNTLALVAFSPDGRSIELITRISASDEVDWTAPAGDWTVYAISQKPSGQKVKRAGPGGEGWMLNPLYPTAMTNWLKWFDDALANYHGAKPQAVFQDSYEYRTSWSPDFFAQFERRRGYKLQDELPALFGGDSRATPRSSRSSGASAGAPLDADHMARVKYDYWRTVSDILAEESEPAWIDWAHRHGLGSIYQAHGTPGNWLDLYGDADMPETEMFHNDRSILVSKFASSAAHTQGRLLVGAETGTWVKEHFTETLADLKFLADDMFLAGVNRIFYHGACYSPADAPWPGWLFYASTEMNPRNPIWRDVPTLNAYITRCQSILQAGQPDNDVLLYWPVADFWSQPDGLVQPMAIGNAAWFEKQPIGRVAHELWNHGYSFDYVSDAQVFAAKITDGKIQMPGGKYQVILIPECKYMPLETFKQLLALAQNGAAEVFATQLPVDVPGAKGLEPQRAEFQRLKAGLPQLRDVQASPGATGPQPTAFQPLGKGMVQISPTDNFTPAFAKCGVRPDPDPSSALAFVRRSRAGGRDYFVANRNATNFDNWITLNQPAESALICDPLTGQSGLAAVRKAASSSGVALQVRLQLAPGQSAFVRAFTEKGTEGPAWPYQRSGGPPVAISGDWKVKFLEGGPVLPGDFQTDQIASWTTFPDTNVQAFAGTAHYEISFAAPDSAGQTFEVNLGDVRQSARVRLNSKDYGTLIAPPFRVRVDNLKPNGNVLEVEITSVAANRIRDLDRRGVNWKIFKDTNFVDENYRPFNAAGWPLADCGLLGPVTLTPARTLDLSHD